MTKIDLSNLTPDQRHLESLRLHGAQVMGPDGKRTELNSFFVSNTVDECNRLNCNAMTFDLFLPEIGDPMMVAIWKDGHIDSGSVRSVCDCLAAR